MTALKEQLKKLIKNALSLTKERKTHLLSLLPKLKENQLKHLKSILDLERLFLGAALKEKLKTTEGQKDYRKVMDSFDLLTKKILKEKELYNEGIEEKLLLELEEEINNL